MSSGEFVPPIEPCRWLIMFSKEHVGLNTISPPAKTAFEAWQKAGMLKPFGFYEYRQLAEEEILGAPVD